MKKGTRDGLILLAIAAFLLIAAGTISPPLYRLSGSTEYARHVRLNAEIHAVKIQLGQYKATNGLYPTTEQGLQALVIEPAADPRPLNWRQLFAELPRDPWGNNYVYVCPGRKEPGAYDLFSAGPDGIADTADDDWGE